MHLMLHPQGPYNLPASKIEQKFEYRGFVIEWVRPPVPPWAGLEWRAHHPEGEGECFFSSLVQDLKDQIDEVIKDTPWYIFPREEMK